MPLYPGQVNSSVYATTGAGYGSSNTRIRRYSVSTTVGGDITFADSATLGSTFTINVSGNYVITRNDFSANANMDVGISKNSTQLSTNVSTITAADRLADWEMPTTGSANSQGGSACAVYLTKGDVIRAHDNGVAGTDSNATYAWFRITRVS